jgi:hypothetical protein
MYSTYYQTRPSTLSKLAAWLASPNLLHALGASLLVVATITVAYDFGGIEISPATAAHARVASAPVASAPVVHREPAWTDAPLRGLSPSEIWAADESAHGLRPEASH